MVVVVVVVAGSGSAMQQNVHLLRPLLFSQSVSQLVSGVDWSATQRNAASGLNRIGLDERVYLGAVVDT